MKRIIIIGLITLFIVGILSIGLVQSLRIEGQDGDIVTVSIFGAVPQFIINQALARDYVINAYNIENRFYVEINMTLINQEEVNSFRNELEFIEGYNIDNEITSTVMREGYGIIMNDKLGNSYECFVDFVPQIQRDVFLCEVI